MDHRERRNGLENWRSIVDELGAALEDTTMVDTPSGGMHLWYRVAGHSIASGNAALAPGIDVKAAGSYVVAPPSIIAGRPYAFRDGHGFDRLADLPPALADLLANPRSERRRDRDTPQPESVILEGARNATLASLAGTMRRPGMSEAAILAALLEDNARRCQPPLDQDEVRRIARSVARYEPAAQAIVAPVGAGHRLQPVSVAELAQREPRRAPAIVEGYAYEHAITDLAAHPKMGKTTFLGALAVAVCRGQPFLGLETRQGMVLYLSEETPRTFLSAMYRVGAAQEESLLAVFRHDAFGLEWPEVCAQVADLCRQYGVVLVIVDTLSDWANIRGDEENSAGAALKAIQPLRDLAELPNLAVIVARHERKSGGEVGQAARGSSQFTGAVDVVVSLRRGATSAQRRLLALSRFDDTPDDLVVELIDGRFKSLGGGGALRYTSQESLILSLVPLGREAAVGVEDIAGEVGDRMSGATVRRVLTRLVSEGEVRAAPGAASGRQVTAVGYWRPSDDEEIA